MATTYRIASYSLNGNSELETSEQILAALRLLVAARPRVQIYIDAIEDLHRNGCRYSNQDFDVLCGARRLARGGLDVAEMPDMVFEDGIYRRRTA